MARLARTHYGTLGVGKDASLDEIKRAYRRQVKLYHPDVNSSSDAEARTKGINEAYAVLGDPLTKRIYDSQLRRREAVRARRAAQRRTERHAEKSPPSAHAAHAPGEAPVTGRSRASKAGRATRTAHGQTRQSSAGTEEIKKTSAQSGEARKSPKFTWWHWLGLAWIFSIIVRVISAIAD